MTLKDLQLSSRDFDLIKEALQGSIESHEGSSSIANHLIDMLLKDAPLEFRSKIKREFEDKMKKERESRKDKEEEIMILQGKLLMLKRHLYQENALDEINQILKDE